MIKKYRKKPVVVRAIQFTGKNHKECKKFIGDRYDNTLNYPNWTTLEGVMAVLDGDYLIEGVKGEIYPCRPDIFEATYEPVEDIEETVNKMRDNLTGPNRG